MGITSFTLSGLGVNAAASGVSGTVPRPRKRVKGATWDPDTGPARSWLRRRNHQLLPDEETIAIGERVFFQDRIFRHAEAGGDPGERVSFAYDVALLLTRGRNRRRARGGGDDREWGRRRQGRRRHVFSARRQDQGHRERETSDPDRARLIWQVQIVRRPVASDLDSSGHA